MESADAVKKLTVATDIIELFVQRHKHRIDKWHGAAVWLAEGSYVACVQNILLQGLPAVPMGDAKLLYENIYKRQMASVLFVVLIGYLLIIMASCIFLALLRMLSI